MRVSFPGLVILLFAASLSAQQQVYEPGDIQRVLLVEANQLVPMQAVLRIQRFQSGSANEDKTP